MLEKKWNEHIEDLNHFLVNTENSVYMEVNKLNPYWMEYHFFYMQVSKSIIKAFKTLKELKLDLTGEYKYEKNKLRGKVLLELKTRRKPLSGQYLMCKEAFVKYNLDLKELQDYLSIYHFNKDKNLYRLILEKDKLSARIEMLNSHPYAEKTYTILQDIKLDQFWSELTASYINNLKSISLRIKQDYLPRPNTRLSNGILWDIYDFFRKENNHLKAIKIAKLNNLYTNIWKEIPTCP